MKRKMHRALLSCGLVLAVMRLAPGCQGDLSQAVVVNEYPANVTERYTVYKVWYRSTLFLEPVSPGQESGALRIGPGTEPAYALLAPSFDVDSGMRTLVPARTREPVQTGPGDTGRLVFSPTGALVGCGGPNGLSREDYDVITTRIFPNDVVVPFDPSGCMPPAQQAQDAGKPSVTDAGVDGG
jgi:hypothetical protein